MPRFGSNDTEQHKVLGSNFQFTATTLNRLGATEYTLATIAVDVSWSTKDFKDDLLNMLKSTVQALKKSPRSENLLVRVVIFSGSVGVREVHGFIPLHQINIDDYEAFNPDGYTPLFDTVYAAIEATQEYGAKLSDSDFLVNAIVTIITDGEDTSSHYAGPKTIKTLLDSMKKAEKLESCLTILVGVNDTECKSYLDNFKNEAALDHFIPTGDVTPQKLAKVAGFVANSVSSQSQSLGHGGPSQTIADDASSITI